MLDTSIRATIRRRRLRLGELRAYLGAKDLSYRSININSGYRREFWVGNCVAVGLSAGFLEPLEASAIVMIELSAKSIAELLPGFRSGLPQAARIFNEMFQHRWRRIVEFLKLHYALSKRPEPFWVDNRQALPDYWQQHSPWHEDFSHREEVFSAASFQYVLYGMGFEPAADALVAERDGSDPGPREDGRDRAARRQPGRHPADEPRPPGSDKEIRAAEDLSHKP